MNSFLDLFKKHLLDHSTLREEYKILLVVFWDTRCPSCIQKISEYNLIYQKFKDRGLELLGISLDEDIEIVRNFIRQNNINWPQYFDGESWSSEIIQIFDINSLPFYLFLDKEGKIIDIDLDTQVTGLLSNL